MNRLLRLPKKAMKDGKGITLDPTTLNTEENRRLWYKVDIWYSSLREKYKIGTYKKGVFHFTRHDCRSEMFLRHKVCCIIFDEENSTTKVSWHKPFDKKSLCRNIYWIHIPGKDF